MLSVFGSPSQNQISNPDLTPLPRILVLFVESNTTLKESRESETLSLLMQMSIKESFSHTKNKTGGTKQF